MGVRIRTCISIYLGVRIRPCGSKDKTVYISVYQGVRIRPCIYICIPGSKNASRRLVYEGLRWFSVTLSRSSQACVSADPTHS